MSLKQLFTSPWIRTTTSIDAVAHLLWILLLKDAIVSAWKKMQIVIKLIQNEYLGWGCQPQGKIKISTFKFCPCSESEILNSQVIPFCELVFVKIDRGTSNCKSNKTFTMNICHICMQIIVRSSRVIVPISIQDKTIQNYVFNCWV
jgi:hypothetical protein